MSPGTERSWREMTDYYKFLDVPPTASQERDQERVPEDGVQVPSRPQQGPVGRDDFQADQRGVPGTRQPKQSQLHTMQKEGRGPSVRRRPSALLERGSITGKARGEGEVDMRGAGAHSSGVNICSFCGQPNYQYNRFCSNCGRGAGRQALHGALWGRRCRICASCNTQLSRQGDIYNLGVLLACRNRVPLYSRRGSMERSEKGTFEAL